MGNHRTKKNTKQGRPIEACPICRALCSRYSGLGSYPRAEATMQQWGSG